MVLVLQYAMSAYCFDHVIPVFSQAVARIGANLCGLYDEGDEQKRFLSVITDAEWGIKLGKLEVYELKPTLIKSYSHISLL